MLEKPTWIQPKPESDNIHLNDNYSGELSHLGGTETHGDTGSWCPEIWYYLDKYLGIKSCLDVGCGTGYAIEFMKKQLAWKVLGIDGYPRCKEYSRLVDYHLIHDLVKKPYIHFSKFDLVWSTEVAEHIQEEYVDNFITTLADNASKYVFFTAAYNSNGYHHVNEQLQPYWINKMMEKEWFFRADLTDFFKTLQPKGIYDRSVSHIEESLMCFTPNISKELWG